MVDWVGSDALPDATASERPRRVQVVGDIKPNIPVLVTPESSRQTNDVPPQADILYGKVRQAEGTHGGSGYVYYGGKEFKPSKDFPEWEGALGPQGTTHAAGPGQWQPETWKGLKPTFQEKFGREPDFSSNDDQKRMVWLNAEKTYGPDLTKDIDAGKLDTSKLASQWQGFAPRSQWAATRNGKWNVSDKAIAHEQGRSNTSVVWMSPDDYLAMTPEIEKDEQQRGKRQSLQRSLELGDDIEAIPTLDVKSDGGRLKVFDQDGRNRAKTAKQEGVDLIAVAVHGAGQEAPGWIEGMRGDVRPFNFTPVPKVSRETSVDQPGFASGVRTAIGGGAQLLSRILPSGVEQSIDKLNNTLAAHGAPLARVPEGGIDVMEAERQKALEAQRGPQPTWGEIAGEIAATLPLAALAPAAGAGLGATLAGAAGAGALGGALSPVVPQEGTAPVSPGEFWKQKAEQAAMGAITGAGTAGAGRVVANALAPQILPAAQRMMDRGVRLTPGQLFGGGRKATEEVSTSVPFSGHAVSAAMRRGIEDFNRSAYDEVLKDIGQKYAGKEIGFDGVEKLGEQISKGYKGILPMIDLKPDAQMVRDLTKLAALSKEMPPAERSQFSAILNNRVKTRFGGSPIMDGTTWKQVESELSQISRDIRKNFNSTAGEKQLASAVDEVNAILREALERQNPGARSSLKALNSAWAKFVRISDAASNRSSSMGVFTPTDLLSAERRDTGRRLFARGKGPMQDLARDGQEVLANRYPDSGTARRYATMGEVGELGGMLVHNPLAAAAQMAAHGAHALAYTSPGLNFLRHMAGAGFPKTRNALSQGVRAGANTLTPGAGFLASGQGF